MKLGVYYQLCNHGDWLLNGTLAQRSDSNGAGHLSSGSREDQDTCRGEIKQDRGSRPPQNRTSARFKSVEDETADYSLWKGTGT